MYVFLQPADQNDPASEHGASRCPVSTFQKYVSQLTGEQLRAKFPSGYLYARGTKAEPTGKVTSWEAMRPGDLALFFRNQRLVGSGIVVLTIRSAELAHELGAGWGQEYELIYVVEHVARDIPAGTIWKELERDEKFILRGFQRVADGNLAAHIIKWLDDQTKTLPTRIADLPTDFGPTDVELPALFRKEQSWWRRKLFGSGTSGRCAVCGKHYPIDLLVAAHIKPRHQCSEAERMDSNNIIPMCQLGCDALFERGYILVDNSGRLSGKPGLTGAIRAILSQFDRKQLEDYSPDRDKYFAARATDSGGK